jgi:transposase, IS5 family
VSRLTRLAASVQAKGLARRTRVRDRRRSVGKRVRRISATLARRERTRNRRPPHRRDRAARRCDSAEARRLARNARRTLRRGRRPGKALVQRLEYELAAAEQVLAQTERRLAGERIIGARRVSLVDVDARPIRRGNPREQTEFGYKAVVADTAEGFVIAGVPERGNPPDDSLLEQAVARAKQAGMQVRSVYADRGFGTAPGDAALERQGVGDCVIPRQQRAAEIERTCAWKRRSRFRNGCEGRISQLKRRGMRRTRLRFIADPRRRLPRRAAASVRFSGGSS